MSGLSKNQKNAVEMKQGPRSVKLEKPTCRYCGATAPEVKITIDHIIPIALGGPDVQENLVTGWRACNGGQSSVPPDASLGGDVAGGARRGSAAMRTAAQLA